MIKLVYVKRGDMMKKFIISLLSVGMLFGIFGVAGLNHTGSPNLIETVQADTTNNSQTINYEVDKGDTNALSPMNTLFTKSATVTQNNDGSFKVTLTARVSDLSNLTVSTINNQTPTVTKKDNTHLQISFNIDSLEDLDNNIPAKMQTSFLNLNVDDENVNFKFNMSSLDTTGKSSSFADSLNRITNAENSFTNAANTAKSVVDNVAADANDSSNIISTPSKTDSSTTTDTTNSSNSTDPKTILKDLTYKISKNNGDGTMISPYFTNTAKVMQNPDGSYYVEVTIKYPRKFGNNAFEINSINGQKPFNISFRSDGDNNYITFDFPIAKITDLSKLIPGDITMNIPDFGLNKDLGFNLDFSSLNPSDLSNLMSSSDTSGLLSDLSSLSNLSDVKPVKSDSTTTTPSKSTLPQTGNATNNILMIIGGIVLVSCLVLLKGTYLKD